MIGGWFRDWRLRRRTESLDPAAELSRLRAALNETPAVRGLRWRRIRAVGPVAWALAAEDDLTALQQVEVEFEPSDDEAGEEMADAPGLRSVRVGTVVIRSEGLGWAVDTPVQMNLTPADLVARTPDELRPWTPGSRSKP